MIVFDADRLKPRLLTQFFGISLVRCYGCAFCPGRAARQLALGFALAIAVDSAVPLAGSVFVVPGRVSSRPQTRKVGERSDGNLPRSAYYNSASIFAPFTSRGKLWVFTTYVSMSVFFRNKPAAFDRDLVVVFVLSRAFW